MNDFICSLLPAYVEKGLLDRKETCFRRSLPYVLQTASFAGLLVICNNSARDNNFDFTFYCDPSGDCYDKPFNYLNFLSPYHLKFLWPVVVVCNFALLFTKYNHSENKSSDSKISKVKNGKGADVDQTSLPEHDNTTTNNNQ